MQLNHNNDLLNLFLRASSGKKLSETLDLTFCQLQLGVKNILMHILCCAFLHKSLFNADLDAPLLNQRIYHCYIILCRTLDFPEKSSITFNSKNIFSVHYWK